MSETTFENAKVGDRVWSVARGWGKICYPISDLSFPVIVSFNNSTSPQSFTIDGRLLDYESRTLFWDEIKITPPERPKRKVTRELTAYCIISDVDGSKHYYDSTIIPIKNINQLFAGKVVKLTGTYEVEE